MKIKIPAKLFLILSLAIVILIFSGCSIKGARCNPLGKQRCAGNSLFRQECQQVGDTKTFVTIEDCSSNGEVCYLQSLGVGTACGAGCVDSTSNIGFAEGTSICDNNTKIECSSGNLITTDCTASNEICRDGVCSSCMPLALNGDSSAKADVVFISDGYANLDEFKEDIKRLTEYDGERTDCASTASILPSLYQGTECRGTSTEYPFNDLVNQQKFNSWMVFGGTITAESSGRPDRLTSLDLAAKCPWWDYAEIISKRSYRSACYLYYGDCYVSLSYYDGDPSVSWIDGRTLSHEFGHGFAQLADEYYECKDSSSQTCFDNCPKTTAADYFTCWDNCGCYDISIDNPRPPNCADTYSEAVQWWGDLEGTGTGNGVVSYWYGCSLEFRNIEPTANSIMNYLWELDVDYEAVNERAIQNVIDVYS